MTHGCVLADQYIFQPVHTYNTQCIIVRVYLILVKFCAQQGKPGLAVETHRSEEKWAPPTPSLKMDLYEMEWLAFLLQGTFSIAWRKVTTRTDASLLGDLC